MASIHWAHNTARELMEEYGLISDGWKFDWNRRRTSNGLCNYTKKTISLSSILTPMREEKDVMNTIIHEIAHAIVGSDHGHNWYWKQQFIEMGGDGNRCSSDDTGIREKSATYVMICPKGEIVKRYMRKPNRKVMMNVQNYWVRGRKAETIGKLQIKRVA